METENIKKEENIKPKFSELSEEEKKLWEVDESLLAKSDEEDDDSGRVKVMGAPVVYSTGFVRPYNPRRRPKIYYRNFILAIILFLAGLGAVIYFSSVYLNPYTIWLSLGYSLLFILCIGKKAVIWLVHFYQAKASDDTRLRCRFEPSCSEYMMEAIDIHGVAKGLLLGTWRIMRCNPFCKGGYDPVPEKRKK